MSIQTRRRKLIQEMGGACQRCGYSRSFRALHFHHVDPGEKYEWDPSGRASVQEVKAHPERFELLCANCHAEAHDQLDEARAKYIRCAMCGEPTRVADYSIASGRKKYCSYECRDAARFIQASAPDTLIDRLMSNVRKEGDCWTWTGRLMRGTPVFSMVPEARSPKTTTAARLAYELLVGPVPESKLVVRTCHTPLCINPSHHVLGNHAEKMRQASLRGSTTRGESSPSARLKEADVISIRERYASGTVTQTQLAKEYGLHQAYVSQIVRRKAWRHLP